MNLQWYPGHMTKAKRQMQENLKLIDLVIELVDARIPYSSTNPEILQLINNKKHLRILTKADLADSEKTEKWLEYYKEQGINAIAVNATKNNREMKPVLNMILEVCKDKFERDRKRGIKNRPVRAMIVGIPNVGKSTFVNSFSGRSVAKTGDKPGVTKGQQWIRLNNKVELLDTPGILWPKFESEIVGEHLALVGSIKEDIINIEQLAAKLLDYLKDDYRDCLKERYNVSDTDDNIELLKEIAVNRGCLLKGAEPDIEKASRILLDEFRSAKLGRISLEDSGTFYE